MGTILDLIRRKHSFYSAGFTPRKALLRLQPKLIIVQFSYNHVQILSFIRLSPLNQPKASRGGGNQISSKAESFSNSLADASFYTKHGVVKQGGMNRVVPYNPPGALP